MFCWFLIMFDMTQVIIMTPWKTLNIFNALICFCDFFCHVLMLFVRILAYVFFLHIDVTFAYDSKTFMYQSYINGPIFLHRFKLYMFSFMFGFMFANTCFEKNQNRKIYIMFIINKSINDVSSKGQVGGVPKRRCKAMWGRYPDCCKGDVLF